MSVPQSQKVLLMGLGASGKSSIRSIVFEGKEPGDVAGYSATLNYVRSTKSIIGGAFQIFDCGGQESFISNFIGDQAEFIFSDVNVLIWVVDVSNVDQVSTSKFYFDHAMNRLVEFSKEATVHCLFHKVDLLLPDMKEQLLETMKQFFVTTHPINITYHGTTIFDKSVYDVFGNVLQELVSKSAKGKNVADAIQQFMLDTEELSGITVYSDEGLPIIEAGKMVDQIVVPANLWLSSSERISDEFSTSLTLKSTIETDEYIFVFQRIKEKLLLTGVAKKVAPLQYVLVKMEQLAGIVDELL